MAKYMVYTAIHKLAHGYDFLYGYWAESTSSGWDAVHKAEGQLLAEHFYDDKTYQGYSSYDQRKETYAMATDGYFNLSEWMMENCPQAYAYMGEQWGDCKSEHPAPEA